MQVTDAPVYVAGGMFGKVLEHLTLPPCLRPGGAFLPLMEGKWIYQYTGNAYAYVSGSGSWVVTRPVSGDEWLTPQYFMQQIDAITRTPRDASRKLAFRDVARWSSERTLISTVVPAELPCGHNLPVLVRETGGPEAFRVVECWANSFVVDYFTRLISSGHVTLDVLGQLPAPLAHECSAQPRSRVADGKFSAIAQNALSHVVLDAIIAELFELTPAEFAYILSTFPLLDRDQPPLPGDHRVRPTNKGIDRRRQSFITRDLALLTYFDYLAGRLESKPDPERVSRICPDGVPEPPTDIVAFFAEAGVDIAGSTDRAVAETGPIRDLRERVRLARELGAVAYVPTIDRRRASFVERAAEAGGLSPDEGVLTPEMARRVLRDKAERDARWQRAMVLWENSGEAVVTTHSAQRPKPSVQTNETPLETTPCQRD